MVIVHTLASYLRGWRITKKDISINYVMRILTIKKQNQPKIDAAKMGKYPWHQYWISLFVDISFYQLILKLNATVRGQIIFLQARKSIL